MKDTGKELSETCPGRLHRQQITYLWVLKGRSRLKKDKNAQGKGRGGKGRGGLYKWKNGVLSGVLG